MNPSAHRPQKKWGQNFLRNRGAARRIVEALEPTDGDVLLEIGPGEGVLTSELLELGHETVAIEIDPDLVKVLEDRHAGANLRVVHGDATTSPLPARAFRAVGNLPYNVGTPILRRVIASPHCKRAVFMLQKEVADRVVARIGDEAYGFLTLLVQIYARGRILMTLEPGSFHPRPKVRSSVVVLDPTGKRSGSGTSGLIDLLSTAFRMRRKTLLNNLTGYRHLDRGGVAKLILEQNLDPGVRAEAMTLEQFDELASAIESLHGASKLNPRP